MEVEADISQGMPSFDIVGLPDSSVKESKDRVRTAMKNCNLAFPIKRVTINLAPANLRKEGPAYDLPIAMAILAASNLVDRDIISEYMFIGELALDGRIRPINGVLPMVMAAAKAGVSKVIVPETNGHEAAVVTGVEVYPATSLYEVYRHFAREEKLNRFTVDLDEVLVDSNQYAVDFSEVKGQEDVRRAVEIAVSGGHNILMIGSPGSGKSMIAKRIPTILPDLTYNEALEITKVHSIAGALKTGASLMTTRPFRNPHHTISAIGLSGGGSVPRPGELSLSHNGVLFMDELPEFHRDALEVMRQPLEDGDVTISRVHGTFTYPCNTLFVASMNPCKCGYYGDADHVCTCTPPAVARYRSKISGPLLDRIDIHIDVPTVQYNDLQSGQHGESSADVKKRVDKARKVQLERYKNDGIYSNSQLTPKLIEKHCELGKDSKDMLKRAFEAMGLSARAHDRILKVARTIADLEESENIDIGHISEAIQYRSLDRKTI
ncbi:ATP-dependent protease [Clostridia bacterium]|nr:ATP-dependent protease [Clostridia bacterium]